MRTGIAQCGRNEGVLYDFQFRGTMRCRPVEGDGKNVGRVNSRQAFSVARGSKVVRHICSDNRATRGPPRDRHSAGPAMHASLDCYPLNSKLTKKTVQIAN